MTRRPEPAKPAGVTGMPAAKPFSGAYAANAAPGKGAQPKPKSTPKPKPEPRRAPAHLPGAPGKTGFTRSVKPVPLPGKSRGR